MKAGERASSLVEEEICSGPSAEAVYAARAVNWIIKNQLLTNLVSISSPKYDRLLNKKKDSWKVNLVLKLKLLPKWLWFKRDQVALDLFWEYSIQLFLSAFIHPLLFSPHFIHTLSGHHASLVKAPNFHDSCIGLMWVSWPDLQGALIKEGDRLLAISFVYSSEQSSAKVERRKQSTD